MTSNDAKANIGVVGMAVMGSNLVRNLASREGNTVAIYNRSPEKTREVVANHPEANFVASESIDDFVASLATPRTAIIMVQAGAGTDAVIEQLQERFEPGDIIVDGGNANFHDTIAREARIAPTGIHFVGAGISGGEEGALKGPSIMPGGTPESYETLGPILASIAAVAEGEACVTHVGTDGAGHFVKMIHNGIEYADMELIGEAYDLLRNVAGHSPQAISDIFKTWNSGPLNSYLIEITTEILKHIDAETGKPFVDIVVDQAGSKGTGVWTVQTALDLGVPVGGVAEAVFGRAVSSKRTQRDAVRALGIARPDAPTVDDSFVDDVAKALYASKIVAYAQGFDAIIAGAEKYGWNIDKGAVAKIWRGGCIIRAQFLNVLADAYAENPNLATLLEAPYFAQAIRDGEAAWRRVVITATQAGVPVPGFATALSYFDSLNVDRLPAALVQGQRDFFGAHTYKRVDKAGTFHTLWSGDRSEVQTD
ncbi:6-phosphogluconate dehydrogenase, decarboxylating OS=Tsukamurella paurometabola (strain ATCC 8368/ DSM / CCUG 35730 / CIP 100753 / JCM 10117 / KCTC 9821/ NBRC 16120 / NCIMB 702349 / NCTC 13040) OX=521096 GN=Tpau_1596 PE=3 SV=1 [Tsukamurella paurometabola]|uniref:6-phosphogluconate dehydrogenase, decarboxylating n=1 Tax=Tsukamurella paurometabola (strain ATCC 8368 / DSM 20162 / CCUG 35730 / CIP 100753 / JCM 10117 / KCTC 9821 / NBRC 16120 / NCIMB 702349 / NCTC 13040) TaxID=521096 RepID=D5UYB0_TSUPD|nr:NADP-dependent phosphogluconate dehydrogenase [Tsukamurella paurometabola]ADG78217.1 6-phosphogluconate dehydrogenase, decarboxylating [Tsukamurella paurometabola DSM 20162]SUP30715.1 6-phosphogluconate dehydrogenase, decarboxylating [Tsukamurella paurometabola]